MNSVARLLVLWLVELFNDRIGCKCTILKSCITKIRSMIKELSVLGITMSILLLAITTSSVTAQNYTTNISNAMGNASATANRTASEVAQNMSNTLENASQSMSEGGLNASVTQ